MTSGEGFSRNRGWILSLCIMTRVVLLLLFGLLPVAPVAQSWSTSWHVVSEDGSELAGARATHGQAFGEMLEQSSAWFRAMGFRAPDMERSPESASSFLARVKDDAEAISSSNSWDPSRDPDPHNRMFLTGNLGMTSPDTPIERLMWASPVHEIFHAVQNAYPTYISGAFSSDNLRRLPACIPESNRSAPGSDSYANAWFTEGTSGAVQVRWLERAGRPYTHHYQNPSHASWVRYFDQQLHNPNLPASHRVGAWREGERAAGRSWRCGYGTWWFWHAVGEMLAEESGQEVGYLHYILKSSASWDDAGLAAVDDGLKEAARVFDSSYRYDEGLYEIYPAFIAEYADDETFYHQPDAVALRGRSEVKWRDDVIAPVATKAFEVRINVDDNATESSRFTVTLDPQDNRDQLHLIAGQTVYRQGDALADEDPYTFTLPVLRDTTILVRLANVAKEAADTDGTPFSIRFELGGFYGAPASGPYVAPDVDIPPGFNVMSGPPELVGCQSGPEGGSVFDLISAAEAVGDIRRAEGNANQMFSDMDEALEDGELPIPGATPQQRAAMKRMIESGAISEAQLAEMRAAIAEAQMEMRQNEPDIDEARAEMAREYQNRSRLIANFVGKAAGKTCQIFLTAGLQGEEGGAQQLSVADDSDLPDDAPLAVGIDNVGYLVGDSQAEMMQAMGAEDSFSVCMMTPEEQARDQRSACPRGCSGGSLVLEEASQGHAKGTLRVDLIRQLDGGPNATCPRIDRRELVVGFNITSANAGQDADIFRGISDEMFRLMGVDPAGIDLFRGAMNGRMFR
ncbi:MAG: hypothetical protein Rubg2KO_34910 [Rubricoccaceae bacterium]